MIEPHRSRYSALFHAMSALCIVVSPLAAQRPPDIQLNAQMNRDVVEGVIKKVNKYYLSAEVAKKVEDGLRERTNKGTYDKITRAFDLVDALDIHLYELSKDAHLKMGYSHEPTTGAENADVPPETPQDWEEGRAAARADNFGFEKAERLPGNIGLLELGRFIRPEFSGEMAGAAMTFLANTDALIIDLRTCRGGSLDMVIFLASYFFVGEEPVYLGEMDCRAENMNQQYWTFPFVPGKRYVDKDVYLLLSADTFSAPEGFASFLQHHKRAIVVGEQTLGGTHPGTMIRVHRHFAVFVPLSRPIYPVGTPTYPIGRPVYPDRKVDYKGAGVKPDIAAPAADALKVAHLEALKKKVDKHPDQKGRLQPIIERLTKEPKP